MNLRPILETVAFLPTIPENLLLIQEDSEPIPIADFLGDAWSVGFVCDDGVSVDRLDRLPEIQERMAFESMRAEEEGETEVSPFLVDDLLGMPGKISARGFLAINSSLTEMILALQNYSVSAEADEFINQLNKESENE